MSALEGGLPISSELVRDTDVQQFVSEKVEIVLEAERIPHLIERFFGLEASLLTECEQKRFVLFVEHALKRQIFSFISSGNFSEKVRQKTEKLVGEDLIFHDIAHSIIALEDTQQNNSIVPYFVGRTARELVNSERALSDEVRALLWFNLLGSKSSFMSLCDRGLGERFFEEGFFFHEESVRFDREWGNAQKMFLSVPLDDFDAVLEVYIRAMYANLRRLNDGYINDLTRDESERDMYISQYDQLVQKAIRNPHPLLVQDARYIFDHQDDPRVLYNLFEKICGSYVDRLERRV